MENDRDDSAFHEPEYSNPASFESRNQDSPDYSPEYQNHAIVQREMKRLGISSVDDLTEDDFIPDYEEVDPVQVEQLRQALKRNSFHKEVVNTTISSSLGLTRNEKYADNTSATKERIMQALIYCIHKVSGKWWKEKKKDNIFYYWFDIKKGIEIEITSKPNFTTAAYLFSKAPNFYRQ